MLESSTNISFLSSLPQTNQIVFLPVFCQITFSSLHLRVNKCVQEDGGDKVKKGKTLLLLKKMQETLTVFGLKTATTKKPNLSIDYETLMMQKEEIQ